jgi:hypothetical protein
MSAWLIECEPPLGDTLYFCNDGDWCSNPNHAHKFATALEAQAKLTTMQSPSSMRIAEHQWPGDELSDLAEYLLGYAGEKLGIVSKNDKSLQPNCNDVDGPCEECREFDALIEGESSSPSLPNQE